MYFLCTNNKLGSEGKHFLNVKSPQRTKLYRQLKEENKAFTLYSYWNFYDDSTWRVIERFNGGQDYL